MSNTRAVRPFVLIASYGLIPGGGETFLIFLANALRERGWPVSFLDFGKVKPEPGIRKLLTSNVPLYRLDDETDIAPLCEELGVDIIHSSHVSVDLAIVKNLRGMTATCRPRHLVTLHGMYEVLSLDELLGALPMLNFVDQFTYAASKNLENFPKRCLEQKTFTLIPNALPKSESMRRSRDALGLHDDALVVMLISRAIPGKGWERARSAAEIVRARSGRDLQLVMIGDGPIYDLMADGPLPEWIHLLGFQADIRSWISIADVGLLPSTFAGESFPLVLIDFLTMGVPVIASSVGEIPQMMGSEFGLAGYIVEAKCDDIPISALAKSLEEFAGLNDKEVSRLRRSAMSAAKKFDFDAMIDAYERVYMELTDL